ncbi:hypothetical protein RJ639_025164 [Escallonia herrerae]|uniref:Clp R domain-containing protein n=1 Tax=Escallonia herrerae TaxID=1293975 RepID=A0AA88RUJ1_9ASTE|nr:hypothetical protein RJ639_025164 [Escallonia herrerae]
MAAHSLSTLPSSSQPIYRLPKSCSAFPSQNPGPRILRSPWLGPTKLSRRSSGLTPLLPKHRSITATVSFSLPTAKPERVAAPDEKLPKWSSKAIKSFAMSELEARKLKYPTTGTEALLMGILIEGTNLAAKFLRANGFTLTKLREEIVKLLGKADMYFFSPEHPPLTEAAQRAIDWAFDKKLKSGMFDHMIGSVIVIAMTLSSDGEITTAHLLLGVWSEVESPGHKIMASFGFTDEKAKELHLLISEPGFVED